MPTLPRLKPNSRLYKGLEEHSAEDMKLFACPVGDYSGDILFRSGDYCFLIHSYMAKAMR